MIEQEYEHCYDACGLVSQLSTERDKEHELKVLWRAFALLLLAVTVYNAKTKERWWPVAEDGSVMLERSTWWGWNTQSYCGFWRRETDASPGDEPRWCVLYPDGSWHTFLWRTGDSEAVGVFFPPKQ